MIKVALLLMFVAAAGASDYYCTTFEEGDGAGPREEKISDTLTGQDCIDKCAEEKKTDCSINGVTVLANGEGGCWCEMEMSRVTKKSTKYKTCFLKKNVECKLEEGDGAGPREEKISDTLTGQDCINKCAEERKTDSSINGVTVLANGEGGCWCEMGMERVTKKSTKYKTCFLKKDVECKLEEGDGAGPGEEKISDTLKGQDCINKCVEKSKVNQCINGVTVLANGEGGCWCEKGMERVTKKSTKYQTCFLN